MFKRIHFNLDQRQNIESGKYKVLTADGRSVRIICWDANGSSPIVGLINCGDGNEKAWYFDADGYYSDDIEDGRSRLVIETDIELEDNREDIFHKGIQIPKRFLNQEEREIWHRIRRKTNLSDYDAKVMTFIVTGQANISPEYATLADIMRDPDDPERYRKA